MWQCIEKSIALEISEPFHIEQKKLISGNDFNLAYQISDQQRHYFVKLSDKNHIRHFESETFALSQIKQTEQISCPDVIALGTTSTKSFIVLSYMRLSQDENNNWYDFGKKLANMHKYTAHGQFGWQHDNYIGDTLQPNQWSSNWRTFFAEQRIAWQLQLLSEKGVQLGDIDHISQICHDALMHHSVEPCLVHGDLWQGNLGFNGDQAVIYDPACYYGDREVDIAMTELFGQLPYDFYQGYQEIFPLPDSYEQRKLIYNFYHILNHANLFGGNFINQSKATLARIIALKLH